MTVNELCDGEGGASTGCHEKCFLPNMFMLAVGKRWERRVPAPGMPSFTYTFQFTNKQNDRKQEDQRKEKRTRQAE